ncbi:DUF5067 domain-containing protein [Levilactobacillus suantsaiihabitans]|uniref:DUF5067 domain-containing protein n=1 Tax=Levilactobacillus suantsaiihabitans TaxID=2487722 RepID=A0A4Z0J9Y6_9LACO|nr:DUF5067 domain-containing protein [Levilactobacillus suantsaiihabitans]TGD19561.1 DUF5067 domain-containing protein [Levilactobacillus suantsaiihabitans]
MSRVKLLAVLGSLLLLGGCGAAQKQPSSQQEPARHHSSSVAVSHASQSQHASSQSAPTATFRNQTFTIDQTTFKLTGSEVTASATANRQLFVLYYTFTNHQNKAVVPVDLWQSAVSATQSGKKLTTGNLSFTTSQTSDNNKLNRTVMPVKAGQTIHGLATFEPKSTKPVTVIFQDTHSHTIHQSHYSLS